MTGDSAGVVSHGGQVGVVIADAQPLFRDAVARAISLHVALRLMAAAADGREALSAIRRLRPEVAVLDLELPALDGRRVLDAIERDGLPTRVVMLSAAIGADATFGALGAGAAGYLSKTVDRDGLCRAIQAAAVGESLFDPPVQTVVAREIRLRHRVERPLLSVREREILGLIATGRTGPEIGRALHLSSSTVKTHIAHLFEKLQVSDRASAVATAMRRGLLD
jgi:two-component system, NarL family, nitrate/nitrite response regulator NarL